MSYKHSPHVSSTVTVILHVKFISSSHKSFVLLGETWPKVYLDIQVNHIFTTGCHHMQYNSKEILHVELFTGRGETNAKVVSNVRKTEYIIIYGMKNFLACFFHFCSIHFFTTTCFKRLCLLYLIYM